MEEPSDKKKRIFTDDFKREATHLVIIEGQVISDVAKFGYLTEHWAVWSNKKKVGLKDL